MDVTAPVTTAARRQLTAALTAARQAEAIGDDGQALVMLAAYGRLPATAAGVTVRALYEDGHPVEAVLRLTLTATGDGGRATGPVPLQPSTERRGFYTSDGGRPPGAERPGCRSWADTYRWSRRHVVDHSPGGGRAGSRSRPAGVPPRKGHSRRSWPEVRTVDRRRRSGTGTAPRNAPTNLPRPASPAGGAANLRFRLTVCGSTAPGVFPRDIPTRGAT